MNHPSRTPDDVRAYLRSIGKTVASWSRENGYSPLETYRLLAGVTKGYYGRSFDIAVKLGMKPPPQSL